MPAPPAAPQLPAPPRSAASLISFICGILGCIPFLGIIAILAGIIGFFRTANNRARGRWMAVAGTLLGLGTTFFWIVSFTTVMGLVSWIWSTTANEKAAVHDFVKALADNDQPAIKAHSAAISDEELQRYGDYVRSQGGFIGTTLNANWNEGGSGHVDGTVEFKSGKQHVSAEMVSNADGWKVTIMQITP